MGDGEGDPPGVGVPPPGVGVGLPPPPGVGVPPPGVGVGDGVGVEQLDPVY